jgi:hypothetical protein
MHYFALLFALLPALSLAAPTHNHNPSKHDINEARFAWAADTGTVSHFLSTAPFLHGQALSDLAAGALAAELDELTHKAVIDDKFLLVDHPNHKIVKANDVLVTQKTFQFVVDGLTKFKDNGASYTKAQIDSLVASMNKDRCFHVLPAIDTYLRVAGQFTHTDPSLHATRPNNCPMK